MPWRGFGVPAPKIRSFSKYSSICHFSCPPPRGQFTSCTSLPPPSFPQRPNEGIGSVTLQPDPDVRYLVPPPRPEVAQGSAFWGLTRQRDRPTDPCPVLPPQPRPRKVQQGGSARRADSHCRRPGRQREGAESSPLSRTLAATFHGKNVFRPPEARRPQPMSQGSAAPRLNRVPDRRPRPAPHPVPSQALPHSSHSTGPLQAEPHPRALWPLGLQPAQPRRPVQVPHTPGRPPPPRKVGPSEWGCSGATWRLAAGPGPLPSGLAPSAASKRGSIGICLPPAGVRPASPSPGFPARFLSKRTWESKRGDDSQARPPCRPRRTPRGPGHVPLGLCKWWEALPPQGAPPLGTEGSEVAATLSRGPGSVRVGECPRSP